MKNLISLLLFAVFSCASTAQKTQNPPQEINAVYFQHWSAGQELGGSGTDFYIEFKKPLAKNTQLIKLFFQNRVTKLEKVSETIYIGRFVRRPEMTTDANGNQTIAYKEEKFVKSKYKLGDNEALLEFVKTKKNRMFIFRNIKEKEYLAYPSAPPQGEN